jgi:CubicO group peptidase (beta-lactamase class C family)
MTSWFGAAYHLPGSPVSLTSARARPETALRGHHPSLFPAVLMLSRRRLLLASMALPVSRSPFDPALRRLDQAAASGEVSAAVLHVISRGQTLTHAVGKARPDTVFLLASITKPMTAAVLMALVEERRLSLEDPVASHLPEFTGGERAHVTIRHLLNHTSGLPDQLPDNLELRRRHAPLKEFVAGAVRAPLRFAPGSNVAYQSMGFLLAAEIAERLTGTPLREQMRRRLFAPLGMSGASLGLGGRRLDQTALCQVPEDAGGWNSPYWRDLGSPWGGAHGTADDVARLLRFFAHPEAVKKGPLRPETARAMLALTTPPARKDRYGLGWRLGVGGAGASPSSFGHAGATGVLSWFDPARELAVVLLTTRPSAESESTLLRPISDLVSAA